MSGYTNVYQEGDVSKNSHPNNEDRDRILSIFRRADDIAGTPEPTNLVQDLLNLITEICQAESANFFQMDELADDLVLTHVSGGNRGQYLIGLRLHQPRLGLPGMSLDETKIMDMEDLRSNLEWLRIIDPVIAANIKVLINLPVINKGHTIGVILIVNYQHAELDLLAIMASRLAAELDRRQEIDTARRSNERLLTLVDMLREVAGTLDRNQLLHLVTEDAARLVDSERSSLILVDPNTSEMVFQVAYQPPEQGRNPETDEKDSRRQKFHFSKKTNKNDSARPNLQEGEFSYFNRSTITVPLCSGPLAPDQSEDNLQVIGGLMVMNKSGAAFQDEDAQLMRILANQASTFLQVAEMYEGTEELFLGVIRALVTAIDAKDPYTQGHSQRVSDYSVMIARELDLEENLINDIRIGSLLHDIGKIGISDSILLKKGTLNYEENELIREHPRTGVNILSQVKLLDPMRPAILEHHERLDGSGYPARLVDNRYPGWVGLWQWQTYLMP